MTYTFATWSDAKLFARSARRAVRVLVGVVCRRVDIDGSVRNASATNVHKWDAGLQEWTPVFERLFNRTKGTRAR